MLWSLSGSQVRETLLLCVFKVQPFVLSKVAVTSSLSDQEYLRALFYVVLCYRFRSFAWLGVLQNVKDFTMQCK